MKITTIICAYTESRWDDLCNCLISINDQNLKPDEIILVIDHNHVLFNRALDKFTNVQVIENRYESGLSGARNSAIDIATGDVVTFIDEDAIAAQDWITNLTLCFDAPNVIGAGGLVQPNWDFQKPDWFPEEFNWVVGCSYIGLPEKTAPIRNLIGCNMAFRREVFNTIGKFQVGLGRIGTLPVGCEETELCIRIKQFLPETIFMYEPRASVKHRVPTNRASLNYFISRCFSEGISKAQVSRLVGANDGLSSERKHTLITLPLGVLRGFIQFFTKFEISGLGKALAIIAGLLITISGYIKETIMIRLRPKNKLLNIHS